MSRLIGLLGKSGLRTQIGVHLAGVSALEDLTLETTLSKLCIDHDTLADHTAIQNKICPYKREDSGDPGSFLPDQPAKGLAGFHTLYPWGEDQAYSTTASKSRTHRQCLYFDFSACSIEPCPNKNSAYTNPIDCT
jgi:hypothetical protein